MAIVNQYGNPIDRGTLKEPQTSRIAGLQNEYLTGALDGLTPARLAATLRDADNGDLTAQHRLFSDMEERDAHLYAEMGKRKLALVGLDWTIQPPRNATAAEKANAEWLADVLTNAVDPMEDLILALMDGVGHGYAPVELVWRDEGGERLPAFLPRPQEWFQLDQPRRQLRLRDMSVNGAALQPFGWIFHTHGKAKTGYLGRLGLHRVVSWPFLYKTYALCDFAEYLETFGLPIIVGKYFSGAEKDAKDSLFRAVMALGHDARAIMPADMQIEINKITGGGDSPQQLSMVNWADRAQSKTVLGQTMSAESKSSGLGSGNADLHREVRRDILLADAREIAGTITRDLLYPLLALNRSVNGLRRCPRLVFDTGEAEDIKSLAEALPGLVGMGLQIPVEWTHDKLRIPQPTEGQPVLSMSAPGAAPETPPITRQSARVALIGAAPGSPLGDLVESQQALDTSFDSFVESLHWDAINGPLLKPVLDALRSGATPEDILAKMGEWYPAMDDAALTETLARVLFVADTWGRISAEGA